MKIPPINIKDGVKAAKNIAVNGYEAVKKGVNAGIKYTKNIAVDTVEFAKKNPRKAGLIALASIAASALIVTIKTALKKNISLKNENANLKEKVGVMDEHIGHQREMIESFKESCADSQEVIDAQHEALEIAAERISNKK